MSWTLTRDIEEFARRAVPRLMERPVDNTLVLTISDTIRAGRRFSEHEPVFGWFDDLQHFGGLVMTPPYAMVVSGAAPETMPDLVSALRGQQVDVTAVNCEDALAYRFAHEWLDGVDRQPVVRRRQRLYRLADLRSPTRPPEGHGRLARESDLVQLMEWMHAFIAEVHLPDEVSEVSMRARIDAGLVWIWEDAAGTPAAFAGRQKTIAQVARIGPVYTPPSHRRRSFGAAVTHASTADALGRGATEVALFTDLANPTSNSIYQQIGFEPLSDSVVLELTDKPA